MFSFDNPGENQNTFDSLILFGGKEMEYWPGMDSATIISFSKRVKVNFKKELTLEIC